MKPYTSARGSSRAWSASSACPWCRAAGARLFCLCNPRSRALPQSPASKHPGNPRCCAPGVRAFYLHTHVAPTPCPGPCARFLCYTPPALPCPAPVRCARFLCYTPPALSRPALVRHPWVASGHPGVAGMSWSTQPQSEQMCAGRGRVLCAAYRPCCVSCMHLPVVVCQHRGSCSAPARHMGTTCRSVACNDLGRPQSGQRCPGRAQARLPGDAACRPPHLHS